MRFCDRNFCQAPSVRLGNADLRCPPWKCGPTLDALEMRTYVVMEMRTYVEISDYWITGEDLVG
jgi:hypothetical protein